MKNANENSEFIIKYIKSPFRTNENDNMNCIYQRYQRDKYKCFEIDGLRFFKIIDCWEYNFKDTSILVTLDNQINLSLKDKLIDENGIIYNVKGFEMFHSFHGEIPSWYFKISFVGLDGDPYKIGNYLAKIPKENT